MFSGMNIALEQYIVILFVDPMKDQGEYLEKHCFGNSIEQEFCVCAIVLYVDVGRLYVEVGRLA